MSDQHRRISESYLPAGLPAPASSRDGLEVPYWDAAREHVLVAQRCGGCRGWQWGPEWICHRCHSFEMQWETPPLPGRLFAWTRARHPVHPSLLEHGPYIACIVELPDADGIRMVGNLLGDPEQPLAIGQLLTPVFEDHMGTNVSYTLVQWRTTDS